MDAQEDSKKNEKNSQRTSLLLYSDEDQLWQEMYYKIIQSPLIKILNVTTPLCTIIADFSFGELIDCLGCKEQNSFLKINNKVPIKCINIDCSKLLLTRWCIKCGYYTTWHHDTADDEESYCCEGCIKEPVCNNCQIYCGTCEFREDGTTYGCGDWLCVECVEKGIDDGKYKKCEECGVWLCEDCHKMNDDTQCNDGCGDAWLCEDCNKKNL